MRKMNRTVGIDVVNYNTPINTPNKNDNDCSNYCKTATSTPSTDVTVGSDSPNSVVKRSLLNLLPQNSIGSLWTVEMVTLKYCGSHFEAAHSLRRIRLLLDEIDWSDRIKFCKADFDAAANVLRKQKQFFSNSLLLEIATISNEYFNLSSFRKLPLVVIQEILLWLPICDLLSVFNVSREWYEVGCSNEIWSTFYKQKFLLNNPPDPKDGLIGKWNINSFKVRLNDPFIGDKVEVAWQGKFRLETQDVYQGLAWWVAEVVDKNTERGKYKIRYPGWESRWDEWVPRHRLRWAVACNNLVSIHVNDIVELWCCGANVPGAWLVSKVKRIRNNRYCIGRVMQSGYVWVERDRIRLVRRAVDVDHGGENSPRPRRRNILQSISSMSHRLEAAQSIASSCSIM